MFEIAEPQTAVFLGNGNAVKAKLAHCPPQFVAREPVFGIDARGQWRDTIGCEARGGIADHVGAFAKREVERQGLQGCGHCGFLERAVR